MKPSADLRPYVERIWVVTASRAKDANALHRVLPDGCTDIIFTVSSDHKHRTESVDLQLMGLATTHIEVPIAHRPLTLGVSFRPGRASALFGLPATELTNRFLSLDTALGAQANTLLRDLAEPQCVAGRVAHLEGFLRRQLRREGIDPVVAAVADSITSNRGQGQLDEVVQSTGLSGRQLRRRFERRIGVGPKLFSQIVRFRALVHRVDRAKTHDWADLALAAGYYDQSHMINEFSRFAGRSPEQHFALR